MLQIIVPGNEKFDEINNRFITTKSQKLTLEHSLVSISKWESKRNKPFLHGKRTMEETLDYIKCMVITQNVNEEVYNNLSEDNLRDILNYIDAPMTATVFSKSKETPSREKITSEIIYYWMFSFGIPMECQKWHLNRLLTLIKVFDIKSNPKKMNKRSVAKENAELNRIRRAKMNTRG